MKKVSSKERVITGVASGTLDEVERVLKTTESLIDEKVTPVRRSVLQRFPVLFLLAVTFGITATITGIEQILIQNHLLEEHPVVIMCIGIGVLFLTGTLYKKLG